MPFTRYFYHKVDSRQDVDWKKKVKERNGVASRDVGGYQAYAPEAWNDELLVGDNLSKPTTVMKTLLKDAEVEITEDGGASEMKKEQVEKPMERYTEADKKRDYKRLDRKLARTLYLCVKMADGYWGFPQGPLVGREGIHNVSIPIAEFPRSPISRIKTNICYTGSRKDPSPIRRHKHEHLDRRIRANRTPNRPTTLHRRQIFDREARK